MSELIKNLLKRNSNDNMIVHPRRLSRYESYDGSSNDTPVGDSNVERENQLSKPIQNNLEKTKKSENEISTKNHKSKITIQNNRYTDHKAKNDGILNPDNSNSERTNSIMSSNDNTEVSSNQKMANIETLDDFDKEDLERIGEFEIKKNLNNDFPALRDPATKINSIINTSQQPLSHETSVPPTVKVSIGRIEVKAIVEKPKATPQKRPVNKPKMSLQDYLDKQKKAQ